MQLYCNNLTTYKRLATLEVKVGDLLIGSNHPIRVQTMTTTDTMDTAGTVAQTIRCIEAGAELVRITAPSKKEAENLLLIKNELRKQGYTTPLVADIHFTPNAAEVAARIVEKVRVNPGNYVDKKKFETIDYTDVEYQEEIDRIRERFTPLVNICREYGTAMRIGTNHGSLSDRIMSRYGDTPMGMVESAMEFLRIAEDLHYRNIVLSMKASNPQVMVQAYRLLVQTMQQELGHCYPLHLGVTEAGDGEDGRIKSAIGIGTLLEDGVGDTIRVSLTEDPEFELPVCRDIIKRYTNRNDYTAIPPVEQLPYSPFSYKRRESIVVENTGDKQVPVVVADYSHAGHLQPDDLRAIGYTYDAPSDKWNIGDAAADYIYTGRQLPAFGLPGTLRPIVDADYWETLENRADSLPYYDTPGYLQACRQGTLARINFVWVNCNEAAITAWDELLTQLAQPDAAAHTILVATATGSNAMTAVRRFFIRLLDKNITVPVIIQSVSPQANADEHLIHHATETGALLLDGFGDGIWLVNNPAIPADQATLNNVAFGILQATRTRISKTEYISCPSCGRTLFDLQETTARIRAVTHHLKGVKIAIMGCIVNGPGEMADADFGYVGSGVGKITLYKGKEIVKRGLNSDVAVNELINLIRENGMWVEKN
ncbi:(E)-4-hydroxy-3-methylbut-2-enyl-diphosphate synthase [Chitinophaga nivalis]|uniref:4-hydroxy-3-methylbut-2-en-1-yl diphosphate synthase (flavodoxin) n=1 Tax=Chitinophaga nivalis TaxID=2991709 RepID=A0ABT3IVQ8_9BACT|nr:(E)-4-hydroxy-3-methylbut-2-enyl-diphosphate synthase [Chitinophaga nivalis]MCW3462248.1 (E)-4-hydroxy-3-methylbut-2-enyl-diphosphate synthase [Chitinophaga nivalis]MCW3488060.1 (E)-4-hydroxy-3-methylbut-2-enyl-diphosphate synthase [Chitinophaga nivalis]